MAYTLEIKRSAEKEMESLPREVHRRVAGKIVSLEMNPRPAGIRKLQGTEGYRLRVGDYRVLYTVDDRSHTVVVYSVAPAPTNRRSFRGFENSRNLEVA